MVVSLFVWPALCEASKANPDIFVVSLMHGYSIDKHMARQTRVLSRDIRYFASHGLVRPHAALATYYLVKSQGAYPQPARLMHDQPTAAALACPDWLDVGHTIISLLNYSQTEVGHDIDEAAQPLKQRSLAIEVAAIGCFTERR